jgi:plastocyanin
LASCGGTGPFAHHALHASATSGSEGELDVGATGVYVPARGTAQFTYRFEAAGELQMGCHLVGHWEAGMVGLVRVGAE